jgi:hypothetical protein
VTGRRVFFRRALAFLGIAGAAEALPSSAVESLKPSIWLVDSTRVDFHALAGTMTLPGTIDAHPNDMLIAYMPLPGDHFPAIMRVPDVTLEELRSGLGNWNGRLPQ